MKTIDIVLYLTIIILVLSLYKYFEKTFSELVKVKSTVDGREYYVQNLPDKQIACDNLAKLRAILLKVVNYMADHFPNDDRCHRLKKNFNPDRLIENSNKGKYTSYSVNKGEKIMLCIRQRNDSNDLVDLNTVTFVAIHELAHLMTKSIGHTDEFWENMKFLLHNVINSDLGVYQYQPFHKDPIEYCGTKITDTPYKI